MGGSRKPRAGNGKATLDEVQYVDQTVWRGAGGETHQTADGKRPSLTTQQGVVVSDDQNTLRSGERGPRYWKTAIFVRSYSTSTTNVYRSESCTHAGLVPTATSKTTSLCRN